MIEKRRSTGPRIGPRITTAQPAPPPTHVQIGSDRLLPGAREVDISQIRPDPDQPRRTMDPARLQELADSIQRHGLLQPLVVRQEELAPTGDMRYVVVAGGRRYAALRLIVDRATEDATRARLSRVMVIVNESEAAERRVLQLVENVQREDLSPVEEARTLKEIMRVEGLSTVQLAARVHRSQGYVDERLRLLRHEAIEAAVEAGSLTKSAGAAIASLPSAEARAEWIARAEVGETIRPREVYASKSVERPDLPNFGSGTSDRIPAPHPTRETGPTLPKFGNPTATPGAADVLTALRANITQLERLPMPTIKVERKRFVRQLTEAREAIERMLRTLQDSDRANIAARSDDSA